jgi:hypothetical protein
MTEKKDGATDSTTTPNEQNKDSDFHDDIKGFNNNYNTKISLHPKLELPIWGLPRFIQDFIEDVTMVRQAPRDFAVAGIFAAISAIIGNKVSIRGKFNNPLMIWIVNVAPSGCGKSQPIKDILQPLFIEDRKLFIEYIKKKNDWKEQGDESKPKPILKQLFINDSTPEARNEVLFKNIGGITLCRDEIAGAIDDIGRYNKSGEVAQMISIYDGTEYRINRKTDEPSYIEKPFMSLIGGIQPDILQDTFGRKVLLKNGFVPRFLFCFPDNVDYPKYNDNRLNERIFEMWNNSILELMDKFRAKEIENNEDFDNTKEPYQTYNISLSGEAEKEYQLYYNYLQDKKREATNSYIESIYSKLQIQVIRIAGITQMANYIQDREMSITAKSMDYAIECAGYFEQTAQKVYECISLGEAVRQLTKGEVIRQLFALYPGAVKAKVADGLGIAKQTINEFLK